MSDTTASSASRHTDGRPDASTPADEGKDAPAGEVDKQDASAPASDAAQRLQQRIEDSIGGAGAGPAV